MPSTRVSDARFIPESQAHGALPHRPGNDWGQFEANSVRICAVSVTKLHSRPAWSPLVDRRAAEEDLRQHLCGPARGFTPVQPVWNAAVQADDKKAQPFAWPGFLSIREWLPLTSSWRTWSRSLRTACS